MRGGFVCAETKELRKRGRSGNADVQILRELARIGVARDIDDDPRGIYHSEGRLSMGKYYENWKAELREKNPPFAETRAIDAAPTPNTGEQSGSRKGVPPAIQTTSRSKANETQRPRRPTINNHGRAST